MMSWTSQEGRLQTGTAAAKPPGSYVDNIDITAYTKGIYLVESIGEWQQADV